MSKWSALFQFARRTGKTTALAEACKKIGGTLVCLNQQMADDTAREHGIPTMSVHVHEDRLRGRKLGPVLFETEAVAEMAASYDRKIRDLTLHNLDLLGRLESVRSALEGIDE